MEGRRTGSQDSFMRAMSRAVNDNALEMSGLAP